MKTARVWLYTSLALVLLASGALAAPGDLVWLYQGSDAISYSSPALSCGYVYVGTLGDMMMVYGKVICLNASTGALVWSYRTGGDVCSSPVVSEGRVYVGSYFDYRVYCLDAATGAWVWSYRTGGNVHSSPVVSGGRVYVGSGYGDGRLYCLDAVTGDLVWSYQTGGSVQSSPAVSGGYVYVGSHDTRAYCLDATTGAIVWSYQAGEGISSSPAVSGGYVYVGSYDDSLYCLDAVTGALVWSYQTGGDVLSSPAVQDDRVYVGSVDHKVYCLDATTGALVWSYPTGDEIRSSPAVSGGYVYIGSHDDNVYCLDAATGALVWSYTTGGTVFSSPAALGGRVYVGSYEFLRTRLCCLEAGAGDPGKWPMFGHDARRTGRRACARAGIGPAGGTLEVDDVSSPLDGVKVVFPAGVLAAQTDVTIAETVPQAAVPGGAIGVPLDLGPDGVALTGPVTVSVPHAAATAHTTPVQVYWWDAAAGWWSNQGISNVVHDASADPHVVSYDAEHFTAFQVAGAAPPPPAASGDDSDDDDDLCFIATAAYGSEFASEVESLKLLRDAHLARCAAGRLLVDVYYACGPYAAQAFAGSDEARVCVRLALRPLVRLAPSAEIPARQ